jgi:hypothetical protein
MKKNGMLFHFLIIPFILAYTPCMVYSAESIPKYILHQKSTFNPPIESLVKPDIPQIEDVETIAVIEPSNLTDNPQISLKLHNFLVRYFLKTGRFKVLERSRMDSIIQEQKLGITGLIDEKQAAKIGMLIGAKAILTGEVRFLHYADDSMWDDKAKNDVKVGSHAVYEAHLKLISVERGAVLWTDIITISDDLLTYPKIIETHFHKLLLKPKIIRLKSAKLISFYDRVQGAGPERYVFSSKDSPVLLIDAENIRYVTLSYNFFKKGFARPKMTDTHTSLEEDNMVIPMEIPLPYMWESFAIAENIKTTKNGIYVLEILANDKVIHEIHLYYK